jgi:trypsin
MAIVTLHDVDSSTYDLQKPVPYLVDMPSEGHAVLISEQWLVTVGHVIFGDYQGIDLDVSGVKNNITKVVFHPDFIKPPSDFDYTNTAKLKSLLSTRSDIALIKLKYPVKHLKPINLYYQNNEKGKIVEIFGKGATGNGKTGMLFDTKHDKKLRFCRNVIIESDDKWLSYRFDFGDSAIPLEGIHGSGDSGGASVIYVNKIPYLVGLSSWQWQGDKSEFSPMLYGTIAYQVRISSYKDWIKTVINGS